MSGKPRTDSKRVLFYSDRFYTLSNFAANVFEWNGEMWPTSEHAYQAARFRDPGIMKWIAESPSPHVAMTRGLSLRSIQREHWDDIKVSIMKQIVRAKLAQHEYVRIELLRTGTREIIENSPTDGFWGRGPDWKGENHLGKIWMELREELKDGSFEG